MNIDRIIKAEKEAKEFIKRTEIVKKSMESYKGYLWIPGNKETGALRRQSMELTRALADMRKSNF